MVDRLVYGYRYVNQFCWFKHFLFLSRFQNGYQSARHIGNCKPIFAIAILAVGAYGYNYVAHHMDGPVVFQILASFAMVTHGGQPPLVIDP